MEFSFAYIPIGVPTFHLESANALFQHSSALLKSIDPDVHIPDELLLSVDKLDAFLDTVNPDYVIVQNATFANGAYIAEVLRRFTCPVLLWTLREPVIDGTRLRLNSLTGAFSAANMLCQFGRPFVYVFGSIATLNHLDKIIKCQLVISICVPLSAEKNNSFSQCKFVFKPSFDFNRISFSSFCNRRFQKHPCQ